MASILIIDDHEPVRLMISEALRRAGHTVSEASNGRAGLALYHARRHDLIITDIVMPGMDGLELIARLRRSAPRPRIIAISGGSSFSDPLYLPTAQKLGVQRTLAKPLTADELLRAVSAVLAESAPPTLPPSDLDASPGENLSAGGRP
jgi:CheY-like chemotaxis protein